MKKSILFLGAIVLLFPFDLVKAEVIINEIQLNPTAERFIELYNTSSAEVNLTGWYIQRKTATGATFGSLVSSPNFGNKAIAANGFFLISRGNLANADIVLSDLTLTESNTIQIKNGAGEVVDLVGFGEASNCGSPCPPNPPEGKSIQRLSANSWVVISPTPRASNEASTNASTSKDTSTNTNSSISTSTSSSPSSTSTGGSSSGFSGASSPKIENPKIKAKITSKSLVFIGTPFSIQGIAYGYSGEELFHGKYFWNFGDGDSKDVIENSSFTHTYFYPGDYTISLEYYSNYYSQIPDAISQMTIKAIPMAISISKVGDEVDFFVEISNNTDYEIDVSKWVLYSLDKIFVLPRNSNILSKKKLTLSPQITNFNFNDAKNLKLSTDTNKFVFDYGASIIAVPVVSNVPKPIAKKVSITRDNHKSLETLIKNSEVTLEPEVPAENLSATALASNASIETKNISYLWPALFAIFLATSASAVYFIRRKGAIPQAGADFKILDE